MASLEIPKWLATYLVFGILATYGAFTINEINQKTDYPDFELFYGDLVKWSPADVTKGYTLHVKYAMAKMGIDYLDNYRVVPFLLSIGCIVVVAGLAVQFTNRWVAAPIASALVVVSNLFKFFDTSAVYDNSWTLFYLLSLYFVTKKWPLVPVFFIAGVLCKPLVFLFLPSIILFAVFAPISKNAKLGIIISCSVISIGALTGSGYVSENIGEIGWDMGGFIEGLYDWFFFLFSDMYVVVLLPISMVILLMAGREKVPYAWAILAAMANVSLVGAPVEALTPNIWNEPYRYVPLLCLFASAFPLVVFNLKKKKGLSKSAFIKR